MSISQPSTLNPQPAKGYKQTEVGVIPEDWQVKPLLSLTTEIGDGIHSTPNYVKSSEFYFVNGNNLVNDRISITDSTMCVSEAEYKTLRKNLTDRTLLVSINGTIGNLAFYNGERVVLGKSAAYINVGKGVSRRFISYCLKSRSTSLFFDNELTGTTIRNLSLQSLRNTPVPMPPTIEEERVIAKALSDVDALLGALDQLIAKKRDLKQAAMQQLLPGQKRLPGFHGEWVVKRLGNVVEIKKGELITEKDAIHGNIPVIAGGKKPSYFHNRANRTGKTITISGSGASAGYVSFFETPIFASDCSTISEGPSYAIQFIYFFLHLRQEEIYRAQTGGAQPHIHPNDLRPMSIRVPKLDEQTAIAEVLSDMDAELAALEQRRAKTRALKQGMMQELLTGRTRLL